MSNSTDDPMWLEIRDGERTQVFPPRRVAIGRDPASDVVVDDASVSRHHAAVDHRDGRWILTDGDSRNGTHHAGRPVTELEISGVTEVVVGDPSTGTRLVLTTTAPPPTTQGRTEGPILRISADGREHEFPTGSRVTIGRGADNDIEVSNPLVSRTHAAFDFVDGTWVLTDLGSRRGITWDGSKIERLQLGGVMTIWLGPEESGEKLLIVTEGDAPPRATPAAGTGARGRRRTLVIAGAALLIAIAAIALVVVLSRQGSGSTDLAAMRKATVRIEYDELDDNGEVIGTAYGSGTIVSEDGLILTNAHVAAPSAPGSGVRDGEPALDPNPKLVRIYTNDGGDRPSTYRYRAKVAAADGYLDLAVLQVVADDKGRKVKPADLHLPSVPLGALDETHSGDEIYVLGYPLEADSYAVNVTKGVVGSRVRDDTRRVPGTVLLNVDARINGGNSGGLAANRDGAIIGVPSYNVRVRSGDPVIGQIRPIDLARPLLASARAGRRYDSNRWFTLPTGNESVTPEGFAADDEPCGTGRVKSYPQGTTQVFADFAFTDIAPGLDMLALLVDGEGSIVSSSPYTWKRGLQECQRLRLPRGGATALPADTYTVLILVGPNYDIQLAEQAIRVNR